METRVVTLVKMDGGIEVPMHVSVIGPMFINGMVRATMHVQIDRRTGVSRAGGYRLHDRDMDLCLDSKAIVTRVAE